MTHERFLRLLDKPDLLASISYEELKTLTLAYPYAHNLRYLLAIKARQDGHPEADRTLAAAAAYSLDRSQLFQLLGPVLAPTSLPVADEVLELRPIAVVQRDLQNRAPLLREGTLPGSPAVAAQQPPTPPAAENSGPEVEEDPYVAPALEQTAGPTVEAGVAETGSPTDAGEPAFDFFAGSEPEPTPGVALDEFVNADAAVLVEFDRENEEDAPEPAESTNPLLDASWTEQAELEPDTPGLQETIIESTGPTQMEPLQQEEISEAFEPGADEARTIEWNLAAPPAETLPETEQAGPAAANQPTPIVLNPSAARSFFVWMTQFSPPVLPGSAAPQPPAEPTAPPSAAELAERSLAESPDMASETLARLLVRQGYINRAIAMYERLCLAVPEKSAYFAAEIEKLKK